MESNGIHEQLGTERVLAQFRDEQGEAIGSPFDLPVNVDKNKLQLICNAFVENEDRHPYLFFVAEEEIKKTLGDTLVLLKDRNIRFDEERVLDIICAPQALFRVQPVARCTASIPGHEEAVLSVAFNADGRLLASGSGDKTVRFWDVSTCTPHHKCQGHKHWVLCLAWSPNGQRVASGCKVGEIYLWDPDTGKQIGRVLKGHREWITSLSWEPLHRNGECRFLASSSKDSTVRVWDTILGQTTFSLSGHTRSVTCVRWGGLNLIYTASQDCTIKVWRADNGMLCRTLETHGHWVNTLALNTEYVMRTGAYEPARPHNIVSGNADELRLLADKRFQLVLSSAGDERMVSGSDDFTLCLWTPAKEKRPVARMNGHQQLVNDVKFSPDGRFVASASFDKSVRLWDGRTGKYLATFRGHVQRVYQVAWAADSRLLVSSSADSTLKVWDVSEKKLLMDLPGHADEVYAVDWSPEGSQVASGGKDRVLKIWKR